MNFQQAMKNPGTVFAAPEDIESSTEFTVEQKRALLVQWKDQLEQLQKASDESMVGPESNGLGADCMRRVVNTLSRLAGGAGITRS